MLSYRVACAQDQRQAKLGQIIFQSQKRLRQESPLVRRCVGQDPIVGFDNINRQNRPYLGPKGQGRVVINP